MRRRSAANTPMIPPARCVTLQLMQLDQLCVRVSESIVSDLFADTIASHRKIVYTSLAEATRATWHEFRDDDTSARRALVFSLCREIGSDTSVK